MNILINAFKELNINLVVTIYDLRIVKIIINTLMNN
jgi:hypothetical protein